ncbi:hypothetical protein [Methylobacterium radiotolerans]|uniref:Uncharacterized protein n=1 Tax=Methylobacterium radiotolerans (strain ATCC 27329 / DSM 1819 / JCM 2831 / NBRC 15690 / NCIMB 10815 / 0-1) TaxID=426355 RepID=B1M9P9_METRJ|nr:hypothetical protein [Methylobacterium radiotolerans]ACB28224.1 hypothetical protein Mrad2831_6302 [Methylobacterium radiotolerans JCM 2831]GEN01775.1 hypothetical protein MRA01_63140 [Methylobacterium radiotolerans]
MSRDRFTVPCHGLVLVASKDCTGGTERRWMLELYRRVPREARSIQLVAIIGDDGESPRFKAPDQTSPDSSHSVWLRSSCVEVPKTSWLRLKALCEGSDAGDEVLEWLSGE